MPEKPRKTIMIDSWLKAHGQEKFGAGSPSPGLSRQMVWELKRSRMQGWESV